VTRNDLFSVIRPSGVYQPDQILDALQWQSEKNPLELQQRGLLSMFSCLEIVLSTKKYCIDTLVPSVLPKTLM